VESLLLGIKMVEAARLLWYTDEVTRVLVRPAVVGAPKVRSVALLRSADVRPPVATAVEQDAELAVLAADKNKWVLTDGPLTVISRLGNFGLMADIHPRLPENPFEFQLVDSIIVQNLHRYLAVFECLVHPVKELLYPTEIGLGSRR
jgi:hypothetical protein